MKKLLCSLLAVAMACTPLSAGEDDLSETAKDTDALYRTGAGATDGAYTSVSISMIGWGLALAAGIAILVAVIHQSKASSAH